MKNLKKSSIVLIFTVIIMLIFSTKNTVRAENAIQEEKVELNQQIDGKKLEKIKTTRFKALLTPRVKVEANPEEENVSKFYYNQLTHDIARNTYNAIASQKSNEVTVDLSDCSDCIYELEDVTDESISTCFSDTIASYILDGCEAYIMDGAENYWWTAEDIKFDYVSTEKDENNGIITFKKVGIKSEAEEWENLEDFNTMLEEVCESITGNSTYEIARSINYYIYNNVEYEILDNSSMEQSAYGALVLKKAVCEGQAQLFNLMCRKKGIASVNVFGWTKENQNESSTEQTAHAWNYVYEPTKKQWYAVDVTWNNWYKDSLYFMVGSDTKIKGTKFSSNHIAGFKQFVAQSYTPATPELATEEYIDRIKTTEDGKFITNIQPDTEYTEFLKEFSSNDLEKIAVSNENGMLSSTDIIKTGQTFAIETASGIVTLTTVVLGDVDGDGEANIKDLLKINRYRLNRITLENEYYLAADVNKDGIVNIKDILRLNRYRLERITEM